VVILKANSKTARPHRLFDRIMCGRRPGVVRSNSCWRPSHGDWRQ